MREDQIIKLKQDPKYHMMVAVLGEYDDTVDYMGPNNSWKKYLIPRTLWGIDCNIASYRHDWLYFEGGNESDRLKADKLFLFDLISFIEDHHCSWPWGTRWLHRKLARSRADKYYMAVKSQGHKEFNYHD